MKNTNDCRLCRDRGVLATGTDELCDECREAIHKHYQQLEVHRSWLDPEERRRGYPLVLSLIAAFGGAFLLAVVLYTTGC